MRAIQYNNTILNLTGDSKLYVPDVVSPSTLSNPMTSPGDLIFNDSTSSIKRLGHGTNGQVLKTNTANADFLEWGNDATPVDINAETIELEKNIGGFNHIAILSNINPTSALNYTSIQYKTTLGNDDFFTFAHDNNFYIGSTTVPECVKIEHDTGDTTFANDITCNTVNYTALNPPIAGTNPMTTAGDMIYGGALGAQTRLAGPTNDYRYLRYNLGSNLPVWSSELRAGYDENRSGTNAQIKIYNTNLTSADNYRAISFITSDGTDAFSVLATDNKFEIRSTTLGVIPPFRLTNTGKLYLNALSTNFTGYYLCPNITTFEITYSGSSLRYKTISETTQYDDTTEIYNLVPKEYYFNGDTNMRPCFGCIAEEAALVCPSIVINQDFGAGLVPDTIDDLSLQYMMLAEMKTLRTELTAAQSTITTQSTTITSLQSSIGTLSTALLDCQNRLTALENV